MVRDDSVRVEIAVALGTHRRVGANSQLQQLDESVVKMIMNFV